MPLVLLLLHHTRLRIGGSQDASQKWQVKVCIIRDQHEPPLTYALGLANLVGSPRSAVATKLQYVRNVKRDGSLHNASIILRL